MAMAYLGVRQIREKLADLMNEALKTDLPEEVKNVRKWLDAKEDGEGFKSCITGCFWT